MIPLSLVALQFIAVLAVYLKFFMIVRSMAKSAALRALFFKHIDTFL